MDRGIKRRQLILAAGRVGPVMDRESLDSGNSTSLLCSQESPSRAFASESPRRSPGLLRSMRSMPGRKQ